MRGGLVSAVRHVHECSSAGLVLHPFSAVVQNETEKGGTCLLNEIICSCAIGGCGGNHVESRNCLNDHFGWGDFWSLEGVSLEAARACVCVCGHAMLSVRVCAWGGGECAIPQQQPPVALFLAVQGTLFSAEAVANPDPQIAACVHNVPESMDAVKWLLFYVKVRGTSDRTCRDTSARLPSRGLNELYTLSQFTWMLEL